MITNRLAANYRGHGWVRGTNLAIVVLQAWTETGGGSRAGSLEERKCWGGYGVITTDGSIAERPDPEVGTWMLTLHNGVTAAVHIPAPADARGYLKLEGLGEAPFKI